MHLRHKLLPQDSFICGKTSQLRSSTVLCYGWVYLGETVLISITIKYV